jgi:hypothetical protein
MTGKLLNVKSNKALVVIVLAIVFPHQIYIKKYRFVYIQQTK